MTDRREQNPDKTPVFGIDDLEPEAQTSRADPDNRQTNAVASDNKASAVALHDALSGARLTAGNFPIEIGNGRRFDMALRGPGPDGLYARLSHDPENALFIIEKEQNSLFMAVDTVETDRAVLHGAESIQLGDHTLRFSLSATGPDTYARRRPKLIGLAIVVALIACGSLIKVLLSADEAESRVSVVEPVNNTVPGSEPPAPKQAADTAQKAAPEPGRPSVQNNGNDGTSTEVTQNDEPLASRTSDNSSTEPAPVDRVGTDQPATQPGQPGKVSKKTPSVKPEPADELTPVDRYQRGLPASTRDQPAAVAEAHSAVGSFEAATSTDGRFKAWTELQKAEARLGIADELSVPRDRIEAALGSELQAAAAQAAKQNKQRAAYTNYHRANQVGSASEEGRKLIATMDDQAAKLYRFGYRLKYSDPTTAGQYWSKVIEKVPAQSEWYQKATLALNDTEGVRG